MACHQSAVERDPGVEHVLIEGGEAFSLGLDAITKQREFSELKIFLLLEHEHEPQPDPEREREAERLGEEVVGLNRAGRSAGRNDEVTEPWGIGQEHDLAGARTADAQLRDVVLERAAARPQPGRAL